MPIDLLMPALSPTMEKGTLARWLVNVGDDVRPGDLLAEIETDKATMEFEAVDEGRISALMVEEGTDDIEVGTVIATLSDAVSSPTPAPALSLVAAKPDGDRVPTIISAPTAILPSNVGGPTATSQCSTADNMSPLAACLVSALGLDFKQLKGSGPAGRILKRDLGLDCNVTVRTTDGFVVADSGTRANTGTGMRSEPLEQSSLRETPSRRLVLDGTIIPQFSLSIDCRIDALLDLRARLNLSFAGEGFKLSLNDFLIKALACALEDVPDANVHFIGNDIQRCGRVDIAIAVAAGGGVIMPVLVDVAAKRLSVVGREVRALTSQARAGELAPEQLQGGTVSLANLGKFGIERALPIINPPQGMILSIGAAQRQVRPIDDQPKIVTMLTATASFDHRAIDGAVAARLMTALRAVVEQPMIVVA